MVLTVVRGKQLRLPGEAADGGRHGPLSTFVAVVGARRREPSGARRRARRRRSEWLATFEAVVPFGASAALQLDVMHAAGGGGGGGGGSSAAATRA